MRKVLFTALFTTMVLLMSSTKAFGVNYYTIDQLLDGHDDAYAFELFTNCKQLGEARIGSDVIKVEKVDDTHLRLCNVGDYGWDFTFTLMKGTSTNATESASGNFFRHHGSWGADNNSQAHLIYSKFLQWVRNSQTGNYVQKRDNVQNASGYFVDLEISINDEGMFHLQTRSGIGAGITYDYENSLSDNDRIWEKLEFDIFQPTGYATHVKEDTWWYLTDDGWNYEWIEFGFNAAEEETFPIFMKYDSQAGTVEIGNFANIGYAVRNTTGNGYNTIGSSGANLNLTADTFAPGFIKAKLNADGTVELEENQSGICAVVLKQKNRNNPDWGYYNYWPSFKLRRIDSGNNTGNMSTYDDLGGTYEVGEVLHNDIEHGWVTNSGRRRTYKDIKITIPDNFTFKYVDDIFGIGAGSIYHHLDFINRYSNSTYYGEDITLDVEMELTDFKWNTYEGVYVKGVTTTNKNDQYVDHYDIMMVKGRYNHINAATFEHHPELGHAKAIAVIPHSLCGATKAKAKANGEIGHDVEFERLVPISEIDDVSDRGEYTFFIRAHYTPESGLTPTFHDLTYIVNNTPSAVIDVEIDNQDAPVEYYNTMGVKVTEPVKGNIYIRHQNGRAEKVVF